MNGFVARAHVLLPIMTVPEEATPYVLAAFERALDRQSITMGLAGGPGTYGWLKWFEDEMPQDLYRWLPNWFIPQLEIGRRDDLGFVEEVAWQRVHSPENAAELEQLFPKP